MGTKRVYGRRDLSRSGRVNVEADDLSVSGVMTSRGVLPRYSCEYLNCASQMLAKQSCSRSSQRCRSCDSHVNAWEFSTFCAMSLATTSRLCTSIVQMVMIFCRSPDDSLPISSTISAFSCAICDHEHRQRARSNTVKTRCDRFCNSSQRRLEQRRFDRSNRREGKLLM